MKHKHVIVIGAGPAGVSAAIELRILGVDSLLIEMDEIGGLLRNAHLVTNYPGFPRGASGIELARLFQRHLRAAGVEVVHEKVLNVAFGGGKFAVKTNIGITEAAALIIASGTRAREIAGLRTAKSARSRIFYEAYPLFGVRGKRIAIIGSGDAAFDYATSLSARNEIVVLYRNPAPKCNPALLEKCGRQRRIAFMREVAVERIGVAKEGLILTFRSGAARKPERIGVDYALVAIGREPRLDFLSRATSKRLDVLRRSGALHLVGDVKNGIYRQTGICVGDGIRAAMEIRDRFRSIEI